MKTIVEGDSAKKLLSNTVLPIQMSEGGWVEGVKKVLCKLVGEGYVTANIRTYYDWELAPSSDQISSSS